MRILLTGASGLIGSAVLACLRRAGHEVVAAVRRYDEAARRLPTMHFAVIDIRQAIAPGAWEPHLHGIDAVVNCAGVFQDSPRDSTMGVHVDGIAALFAACETAGVRRVVQISALGVSPTAPTRFLRSKHQGDAALMARDLDWVILRPSVVVGRAVYGGSALFRGLAALPLIPLPSDAGLLQIVQLDDVARTVLWALGPAAPARQIIDLAGPDRLSLTDVILAYRRWLGFGPARIVSLPRPLAALMFRLGDLLGALGWRPPMRSTARHEMARGSVGDPGPWTGLTGIVPQRLAEALAMEPASVQERWFARLYFVKPLVLAALSLFWIASGLLSLGPGHGIAGRWLGEAGAGGFAPVLIVGGGLVDVAIGLAIAVRATARLGLCAAMLVSLAYALAGTILLPSLWLDPLAPLLKIIPILALNLVALAILDDR